MRTYNNLYVYEKRLSTRGKGISGASGIPHRLGSSVHCLIMVRVMKLPTSIRPPRSDVEISISIMQEEEHNSKAARRRIQTMRYRGYVADREEISLSEYGLDCLVNVELRNWIRRDFSVELALTAIVGAENLRALSERIVSLMSM